MLHLRERVGHAGAVRQVELELAGARALAQHGEEPDADAHGATIIGGVLLKAWIAAARLRRKIGGDERPRQDLVAAKVPGRSFVDVGCMWNIHGGIAFAAEEAGATRVTGMDVMAATPEFETERERRGSEVRFVHGDLHDPQARSAVGPHDVVCSRARRPHPSLGSRRCAS